VAYCTRCGGAIANQNFCTDCGAPKSPSAVPSLETDRTNISQRSGASESSVKSTPPTLSKNTKATLGCLALLVFLLILAVIFRSLASFMLLLFFSFVAVTGLWIFAHTAEGSRQLSGRARAWRLSFASAAALSLILLVGIARYGPPAPGFVDDRCLT
jgi:hypothetical protein